jgi:hypothetical protein
VNVVSLLGAGTFIVVGVGLGAGMPSPDPSAPSSGTGGFARYGWLVGGAVTTATVNSGATTFTLGTTSRGKLGPNVRISIGSDTNTGAGYLVTAVNQSTGVVTFSPALGTTQTGTPAIAALVATPTYSGTLRGGIDHTFTLASTDYGINSSKTSIKTGLHGLAKSNKEGSVAPACLAAGWGHGNQGAVGGQLEHRIRIGGTHLGKLLRGEAQAACESEGQREAIGKARRIVQLPRAGRGKHGRSGSESSSVSGKDCAGLPAGRGRLTPPATRPRPQWRGSSGSDRLRPA